MEHFLKATYEVTLDDSRLYLMLQREDDYFAFVKVAEIAINTPYINDRDRFHDIDYRWWGDDARQNIKNVLAGKLMPVYVYSVAGFSPTPQNAPVLCSCPNENYQSAYGFIGCTCGATKKGKG